MLAAPAGGTPRSHCVGGGEGLFSQHQLRNHTGCAHQPGAVHVLEGPQPPRVALAPLRPSLPGAGRRAARYGRPHAPRAAGCAYYHVVRFASPDGVGGAVVCLGLLVLMRTWRY